MTKRMRSQLVLALVVAVAGSVGFAQSGGEAVYKANCQSCHGSAGHAEPGNRKVHGREAGQRSGIQEAQAKPT